MKHRRGMRVAADQQVQITVLGEPDINLPATLRNLSGRGVGLSLDGPLAVGSALKLILEDEILLGEVIYCRNQDGAFYVGVELQQALSGLADLAAALRSFSGELSGAERPNSVQHTGGQHQQKSS
jgi:hypothetical protein